MCTVWRCVGGTIRPLRLERSYFREKRVRLLTAGEPSMAVTQMQVPVGLSDHHAIECTQYALRDMCGAPNLAIVVMTLASLNCQDPQSGRAAIAT